VTSRGLTAGSETGCGHCKSITIQTRSSAVAVIADHTVYEMLYGIAAVTISMHLLIYSFKLKSAFTSCKFFLCFVAKRYILRPKRLKWIGSALLGTWRYNFLPSTPTLSATMHSVIDGWMTLWWQQSIILCAAVWSAKNTIIFNNKARTPIIPSPASLLKCYSIMRLVASLFFVTIPVTELTPSLLITTERTWPGIKP